MLSEDESFEMSPMLLAVHSLVNDNVLPILLPGPKVFVLLRARSRHMRNDGKSNKHCINLFIKIVID